MKIIDLHIGMNVLHPQYGSGVVKGISEHTADILFQEGKRIVDPEASEVKSEETHAQIEGLKLPLQRLIRDVVGSTVQELGLESTDTHVHELGAKWHKGTLIIKSADSAIQPKDVPLEVFFHKIVMIRNNLRVLEQKINSNDNLTSGEKFDCHQYITRCYGSLTTFNVLFKDKESHFSGSGGA